ncbi:hypothetical protein EV356DRAFT_250308 [Viridothelium virens]|uniref:Rhodopsin domain-containing protein n=1 Tax=Viridothelium virens TaxID=1048519 RepID=A0A6A6H3E1_VIRVR|nr:hypothetical protein EV356DRAFT_250308 [Viridothelium virens]
MAATRFGRVISVIAWTLLVRSMLAMAARFITKFKAKRPYGLDDALAIGSLLFCIGSGIAVSILDVHGLGAPGETLTTNELDTASKALYAGNLLFIASLALAKLSIVVLIHQITPSESHRRLNYAISALVTVAAVTSIFAEAFQCALPTVWLLSGARCINRIALWSYFGTVQLLSDICLIGLPIYILFGLQLSFGRKLAVLVCFGTRIFDIAAISVQFKYVKLWGSSTPSEALWPWVLMTQIIQFVTIISACVPYLRPLLTSYPSGMFTNDEIRRKRTKGTYAVSRDDTDLVGLRDSSIKSKPPSSHDMPSTSY